MHVPQFGSMTWQLPAIACVGVSALLLFGLFTPLAAIAGAVIGGACLAFGHHADVTRDLTLVLLMLSLALIGAGAYSIDAKLYGRREIVLARKSARPTE